MKFTLILKVFGLVMAGFVGLFTLIIGYLFATGGFNPPYIPPEGIYFAVSELTIDKDTEIFVLPTPENATELEIELSILSGSSIIKLPEKAELTKPILVEVLKDGSGNNIGGVARIRANQGLLATVTTIFVDIPVESFNIVSTKTGSIYVNDTFTVSPASVYPQYSLNPSVLNQNYNRPNKVVKYYSSNEDIATVDELTGLVTAKAEGTFTIEARVIKTYNLVNEQPNPQDFEYEEDYWAEMDEISAVARREFTISSIAVSDMQVNDNAIDPLYSLYLYEQTHIFTPADLGLKLLPQADSNFTWEQLNYKLKDLEVISMHKNDLGEYVENENITIEILEEPLRYKIVAVNFESWEIKEPGILFKYSDEIFRYVHFKVLRNDITNITIQKNKVDSIEMILNDPINPTYNLVEKTIIGKVNPNLAPTYNKVIYKVDLNQAKNESNQFIINIDPNTGYIINDVITPLNRGTTRIKAFVIQTDISGTPILENGNYIVMFEMNEYVTVNVLEKLSTLQVSMKKPKDVAMILGDTLEIELKGLTPLQQQNYETIWNIVVSNENRLRIDDVAKVGNSLFITLTALSEGSANLYIINTQTNMIFDYVEIGVITDDITEEVEKFSFEINSQTRTELVRGTETYLVLTPNSYGAFVDAYKYGKLEFISTNPNMMQIYSTIDANDNVIIKLVAVGFDINPNISFSMLRIRLTEAGINEFLVNERINISVGAVNGMYLSVNSTTIYAIPGEDGTQWLTADNKSLLPTVSFSNPAEPAVTGVYYISGDPSILEINNNIIDAFGAPQFIFKKGGVVSLTAKSLDPYAIPTNPLAPENGAYSSVQLTIITPTVGTAFNYVNPLGNNIEQVVAGDVIDLLEIVNTTTGLKPRVKIFRQSDGVDYTDLAKFEVVGGANILSLQEVPKTEQTSRKILITTYPVGSEVIINIRVYTDFGFSQVYVIKVLPNILYQVQSPPSVDPLYDPFPEVVYPPVGGQVQIKLLELQNGVTRVRITDRNNNVITGLNFELSNESAGQINEQGQLTIWYPPVERELSVRIFITFDSDIDFEIYYNFIIKPTV